MPSVLANARDFFEFVDSGIGGRFDFAQHCAQLAAERAFEQFKQELPAARFYKTDSRITHVYGPSMGFGATPREAADAFIENHAEMFGVLPADLRFKRSLKLMYGKFTAVQYDQLHQGVEVRLPDYSAGITILTRADVGNGIVQVDPLSPLGLRRPPPIGAARDSECVIC